MFLYVKNEKRERFDEIICFDVAKMTCEINKFFVYFENVIDLNIENFDKIIDWIIVVEIVEMLFLFFSLLKFRFETFLIVFFDDLT